MTVQLIGKNHGQPFKRAGIAYVHPFVNHLQSSFNSDPERVIFKPGNRMLTEYTLTHGGVATSTGGISVSSNVKSRSAKQTREVLEEEIDSELAHELSQVILTSETQWFAVQRRMGEKGSPIESTCLTIMPTDYARIGLMWGNTLFPATEAAHPDSTVIFIPAPYWKHDRQIVVMPNIGVTLVLGSDYMGEAKKGHLRMVMNQVFNGGLGLGLHAGTKSLLVFDGNTGMLTLMGFVLIGLSGTGKTSLSGSDHGLKWPETTHNHQDDFTVAGIPIEVPAANGTRLVVPFWGTELGYYLKTEGEAEGSNLHRPLLGQGVVFENVALANGDTPDFMDYDMHGTRNGRAVVDRKTIPNNSERIDGPDLRHIVLIYRDPFMPEVARVSDPNLAAALFLALQSVITSAATQDTAQWGKATFEAGANPFVCPNTPEEHAQQAMYLRDLIVKAGIEVAILNTGEVGLGQDAINIGKPESERAIAELARNSSQWEDDPKRPGLQMPASSKFNPWEVIPEETVTKRYPESVAQKRGHFEQFRPFVDERISDAFDRFIGKEK